MLDFKMVNGKVLAGIVIAVLIILGAYFFVSVGNVQQSGNSVKLIGTGSSVIEDQNTIEIKSNGFFPEIVTISAGDEVTFVNKDSAKHEVAIKNFNVNHELNQNEEYKITFEVAGTFEYYDRLNNEFAGTIVVQ